LTSKNETAIDVDFRKRVQAVQSVDRMIGSLQMALRKAGVAGNTDIVFSSDNGYHMGEYRLNPGKMTAFETDIHVPLVISGPGIRAGRSVPEPAENIDLCPTFESLGGAAIPSDVDGHSLVSLLTGGSGAGWRTTALVEHHGPDISHADPDLPGKNSGNPPSYEALRTATFTYVEYAGGGREYYDRTSDPDELHNTVNQLPAATLAALHRQVRAMSTCRGQVACWAAAR
jgi:arylsulfatase A-like enzyme